MERRSRDTITDHAGEQYPWVLPEDGVHLTEFTSLDALATALDVTREVANALVSAGHDKAVTSFDFATVQAGCGCGWFADARHVADDHRGREAAAADLAGHLADMTSKVEWFGPDAARAT